MAFWDIFSGDKPVKTSAGTAADRLKIIIASENRLHKRLTQDNINAMKYEIMQVVARYVRGIDLNAVNLSVRNEEGDVEVLEMNITLSDDQK